MKSLIVYYSYSGNTEKVANILKDVLTERGQTTDIVALKPEDESDNFFKQCMRAVRRRKAILRKAPFDVSFYDMVCVGNPVWAFAPTPAVNTYIDGLQNLKGKDVTCFITCGSGRGGDKCLRAMKVGLKEKGAFRFFTFKVPQNKVDDENFVKEVINRAIR